MAATVVLSSNATLELLHIYNYDEWSLLVRTYLIAEGLWDVVDDTATTPNSGNWRKKNAKALHVIQISCRTDVLRFILDRTMAKDAWETLAKRLKPRNTSIGRVNAEVDSDDDDDSSSNSRNAFLNMGGNIETGLSNELVSMLKRRDWEAVREFLIQHPEAVRADIIGGTPLHYVIVYDMVDGVKELLKLMNEKDLHIVDDTGGTALSESMHYFERDGRTEIVKCVIRKNEKLLLCDLPKD